jgi:hypothetical protein
MSDTINDPYKCVGGKWIKDEEAIAARREKWLKEQAEDAAKQKHQAAIWDALRTRVLTEDEMREALGYGDSLNIGIDGASLYNPEEKSKERLNAFQMQLVLRQIAALKPCEQPQPAR